MTTTLQHPLLPFGSSKLTLSPSEASHTSAEERIRTMNAVKAGAMSVDQALTLIKSMKIKTEDNKKKKKTKQVTLALPDNKAPPPKERKKAQKAARKEAKRMQKQMKSQQAVRQLSASAIDHLRPWPAEKCGHLAGRNTSQWDQLPIAGARGRALSRGLTAGMRKASRAAARAAARSSSATSSNSNSSFSSKSSTRSSSDGSACSDGNSDLDDIFDLAANADIEEDEDDCGAGGQAVITCDLCAMVGREARAMVSCSECAFCMCSECDEALHNAGQADRESARRANHIRVPLEGEGGAEEDCKCTSSCSPPSSSFCSSASCSVCSSESDGSASTLSSEHGAPASTSNATSNTTESCAAASTNKTCSGSGEQLTPKQQRVARRRAQLRAEHTTKRDERERVNQPPRFADFDFAGCFIYTASDEIVDGADWNTHKAATAVDKYRAADLTPEEDAAARKAAADPDAAAAKVLVCVDTRIPWQEEIAPFKDAYKARRATLADNDTALKSKYAFYNRRLQRAAEAADEGSNNSSSSSDDGDCSDDEGSIDTEGYGKVSSTSGGSSDAGDAKDERVYDVAGYLLPTAPPPSSNSAAAVTATAATVTKAAPIEPEPTYLDVHTFAVEPAQAICDSAVAVTFKAEDKHRRSRPAGRMFAALPTHRELVDNRTRAANLRRRISRQNNAAEHMDVFAEPEPTTAFAASGDEEDDELLWGSLSRSSSPVPCPNPPPPSPSPEDRENRPSWFLEGLDTEIDGSNAATCIAAEPLRPTAVVQQPTFSPRHKHAEMFAVDSVTAGASAALADQQNERMAIANRMARMLQRAGIVGTGMRTLGSSSSLGSSYSRADSSCDSLRYFDVEAGALPLSADYCDDYNGSEIGSTTTDDFANAEVVATQTPVSTTGSTITSTQAPPSLAAVLNMGVSMPAARSSWNLMGELKARLSTLNLVC